MAHSGPPPKDFLTEVLKAVRWLEPGSVIEVGSELQAEIARAAVRLYGQPGVEVRIAGPTGNGEDGENQA